MQNIEIKAVCEDLRTARRIARSLAPESLGRFRQRDTYFQSRNGLLKLRETPQRPGELIGYQRPNIATAKRSDYRITSIERPAELRKTLADALGIVVVVEKVRDVFLWHNVRIHLDRVKRLGTYLEFEAVLRRPSQAAAGHRRVAHLLEVFGITPQQLIRVSYAELLRKKG